MEATNRMLHGRERDICVLFEGEFWKELIGGRGGRVPRHGLSAQKCSRGIDVQRSLPFFRCHFNSMCTAHHARKAAQDVHAPQLLYCLLDRALHLGHIGDVDSLGENSRCWEVFPQTLNLGRPVREVAIEEHETYETVLEEGTRINESESACTAGH